MKKHPLLLLILFCSTAVFSQNKEGKSPMSWGIRLGANASKPDGDTYAKENWEISQQAGIYLENSFLNSKIFDIRGEFLGKMTRVSSFSIVKMLSIELPVSLRFSPKILNKNLGFFLGLVPSIPISSESDFGKNTKFSPPVSLGYFAGISILFPFTKNALGLDFRYYGYFTDNYAYKRSSPGGFLFTITDKLSTLEASITYRIW